MLTLKADSRQLIKNAKFSYLSDNYASGVTALVVTNSDGFLADDYILLGEFGTETAEIKLISSVTTATHTLNLTSATTFAQPQDTKVTIIKYNQVKFYRTATATFSESGTELTIANFPTLTMVSPINIQPDSYHTKFYDNVNSTGFGWFKFYNEHLGYATTNSNAIPYGDFEQYSAKKIIDAFFSLLNKKEEKLITIDDAFRWLNEGYAIAKNELNLVNQEYGVPAEWSFTTVSGTAEYALPSDFSELLSVNDDDGDDISFLKLADVKYNNETATSTTISYFLRGSYIGISPVPTTATTYYVYYKAKTAVLTSYYENIDLPDNNYYPLVDFMMYRASIKLGKAGTITHLDLFRRGIDTMKVISHKQNENLDSWSIADEANV